MNSSRFRQSRVYSVATKVVRVFTLPAVIVVMNALFYANQVRVDSKVDQVRMELERSNSLINSQAASIDSMAKQLEKLRETHPYQSKKWRSRKTGLCRQGTFFAFLLYTPVDTSISKDFAYVLSTYQGPTAKVNSVRRGTNLKSRHYCGNAIDLAWDEEVITFLISEEGRQWLEQHGITMYIEGKPRSKRVQKYVEDPIASSYVFFNPKATGDHIHLNI